MNRVVTRLGIPGIVALAGLLLVLAPVESRACSICRCGDAAFNALGKDGYAVQGLRLALDWERFDKDEGDPSEEMEAQVENRLTAFVSYGFNDRFTLFARVPYSVRDLTASAPEEEPTRTHTSGLSDPEAYAQLRVWSSPLTGGVGKRASLSLTGGIKAPWGRNQIRQGGERLDEHAQSGTGSTDVFGSAAFLYLVNAESTVFASSGYRHTGENDFGYRYGRTFLASVAYEHKLGSVLDGVVEMDFRNAGKDRVDATGTLDENTGGSLLYVTPRLLAHVGHGLVVRAAVQIPIARALNGFQTERVVVNVGLTYLFAID